MTWLAYWLGLTDANSGPYLWWSGSGGKLVDASLFAGFGALLRWSVRHLKQGIHVHHHHDGQDQSTALAQGRLDSE